jgi:hypothetical protein
MRRACSPIRWSHGAGVSKDRCMTRHRLDPSPSTTVDVFARDLRPALTVDPGDIIGLRSLNASGHIQPQTFPGEKVPTMVSKKRSGHCLTGPIAVRGSVPGDVLAVRFISLRPDTWGYTVAAARDTPLTRRLGLQEGPPAWLLWQIYADAGVATSDRGHTVRIAPFHGVIGVAWDEPGEHSTIPPRAVGAAISTVRSWSPDRFSTCRLPCLVRCCASAMATLPRATEKLRAPLSSAA